MSSLEATNKILAADYIYFKLRKSRFDWPVRCPVDLKKDGGCAEAKLAMRNLGEEFEERYRGVFNDMCQQLHITPNNASATFRAIIGELFSDGIRWGRIVALFSFSGCLAVECMERKMPHLVDEVLTWTTAYLDEHLSKWIQDNNGWDGFVEFSKGGQTKESPWPSFKTLCGYAVGALGVLTLGAILSQRS
ncbi:hypothetical protein HELRODRAFT_185432 [Helobdella robusta]|uniref:Bcl-2 Bcl-2 homology region 1-3 domain-containing protein n=1 Tax=Helobdella robusta TaxID=6412 RepID=T1FMT5_HELRO|nr:hypothetical protein HELRODRAFT_185432 [Helobdella robusta]ESO08228.1 hypothetical protein HELRODRAFT_185432 [Helobdella robusta]